MVVAHGARLKYYVLLLVAGFTCPACNSQDNGVVRDGGPIDSKALSKTEAIELAHMRDDSLGPEASAGYTLGDHPWAWRQPDFEQRYTGINFNSLRVIDRAKAASGEWLEVRHQESANFAVMRTSPGGLDGYALLGISRDDDLVVELWNLVAASGAVVVTGGQPGEPTPPQLVSKAFVKTRVFKGANGSTPVAIELDPQQRFILYAARDPQGVVGVFQVQLQGTNTVPQQLLDSTEVPALDAVRGVEKFDHAILGRIYGFGMNFGDHRRVVLVDSDDDGAFDGPPIVGDPDHFESLGLDRYEDWVPLYR